MCNINLQAATLARIRKCDFSPGFGERTYGHVTTKFSLIDSLFHWVPGENVTGLAYFPLGFFQREELKDLLFLMRDRLLAPADFQYSLGYVHYLLNCCLSCCLRTVPLFMSQVSLMMAWPAMSGVLV